MRQNGIAPLWPGKVERLVERMDAVFTCRCVRFGTQVADGHRFTQGAESMSKTLGDVQPFPGLVVEFHRLPLTEGG